MTSFNKIKLSYNLGCVQIQQVQFHRGRQVWAWTTRSRTWSVTGTWRCNVNRTNLNINTTMLPQTPDNLITLNPVLSDLCMQHWTTWTFNFYLSYETLYIQGSNRSLAWPTNWATAAHSILSLKCIGSPRIKHTCVLKADNSWDRAD